MKYLSTLFNTYNKYRTLSVLRQMSQDQLVDIGIAPERLAGGVAGYPWHNGRDNWTAPTETFKRQINAREVVFNVNPKEAASGALSQVA